MKIQKLLLRVLTPPFVVSLYYYLKFGAKISPRAEVEISDNLILGANCVVSSFTKIKAADGPLQVGEDSGFATGCFITSGKKGIIIGKHFVCGPNVNITASNYALNHLAEQIITSRGIKIGNNVWIGGGSSITDGAELGDNTFVAANSLVNRKFPPNVVVQGNPAQIVFENKPKKHKR